VIAVQTIDAAEARAARAIWHLAQAYRQASKLAEEQLPVGQREGNARIEDLTRAELLAQVRHSVDAHAEPITHTRA
jgi:hypothetical protein